MLSPQTATQSNFLLSALPVDEYQQLVPSLKPVKMRHGEVLYQPDEPINHVYFPVDSIISTVTHFEDGTSLESGIVGREGMTGVSVALFDETSQREVVVQSAGRALQMETDKFRGAFESGGSFQQFTLRYVQAFLEQVAQCGACGNHHSVSQRLARWLLMWHDRTDGDVLSITQDFLAQMLGVHRPGVTHAALAFREAGLINYHRGTVNIINRVGLEAVSCECYQTIKRAYERYASLLELRDLNQRLDRAQKAMSVEMRRRREIQKTTQENVYRLYRTLGKFRDIYGKIVMCSHCRQVRDEHNQWLQVDESALNTLKFKVSHSICPPCAKMLYPRTHAKLYPED